MDKTQQALIKLIEDSGIFQTVKSYAGEIESAIKINAKLPAAFVIPTTGVISNNTIRTAFTVLVVSENKAFDKESNLTNNLHYTSELLQYCNHNLYFTNEGESFCFNRDVRQSNENDYPFTWDMKKLNERFAIVAVYLSLMKA